MAKATLYVFSSPTCPHCPTAKAIAGQVAKERDDVIYKDVVSGMAGSNKLFKKFDIASVPTIIIQGPAYPQNIGLKGTQPVPTLNK
ncbi:MAG: thioredoxin family protein, partial [Candidatus Woesearchaeota archaeon]